MKDTEFMTGKEKELVLKQWMTFIKNGFKRGNFQKSLYLHLTLHCSFIAHFNINGFYQTYFESPDDTIRFLRQFDKERGCVSVEYGGTYWKNYPGFADLNTAMCDATEPFKENLYQRLMKGVEEYVQT